MTLYQWAIKWHVSMLALQELDGLFGVSLPGFHTAVIMGSEAHVQSLVRLEAARKGVKLWRNNVGAIDGLRYGLANDSPKLNAVLKSGDLIGWRPLVITPEMVGSKVAQFVSRECKRPNWIYSGTDHERAQLKWIQLVCADGGDARFVVGEGSL